MRKGIERPATLVNLGGHALPPVVLNISQRFQFCVDAGAAAAVGFFDSLTVVGLHDHIALSMHMFMRSIHATADRLADKPLTPGTKQECTDAFAAGYLGRIQQELRIIRGVCACGKNRGDATAHRCAVSSVFRNGRH
jgi:hypothetical protein